MCRKLFESILPVLPFKIHVYSLGDRLLMQSAARRSLSCIVNYNLLQWGVWYMALAPWTFGMADQIPVSVGAKNFLWYTRTAWLMCALPYTNMAAGVNQSAMNVYSCDWSGFRSQKDLLGNRIENFKISAIFRLNQNTRLIFSRFTRRGRPQQKHQNQRVLEPLLHVASRVPKWQFFGDVNSLVDHHLSRPVDKANMVPRSHSIRIPSRMGRDRVLREGVFVVLWTWGSGWHFSTVTKSENIFAWLL